MSPNHPDGNSARPTKLKDMKYTVFITMISASAALAGLDASIENGSIAFRTPIPVSEPAYSILTNDVCRYYHSLEGFSGVWTNAVGECHLRPFRNPVPLLEYERAELFEQGVRFVVEEGATNCVLTSSVVNSAWETVNDLVVRTNLFSQAEQFVDSLFSGSVTNGSPEEVRHCAVRYGNGQFSFPYDDTASGSDLEALLSNFSQNCRAAPLCILTLERHDDISTGVWILPLWIEERNPESIRSDSTMIPLVYLNGQWRLCFVY